MPTERPRTTKILSIRLGLWYSLKQESERSQVSMSRLLEQAWAVYTAAGRPDDRVPMAQWRPYLPPIKVD